MNESEKENREKFDPISLSSALLAPINSIFEAQIHAARAFLNFIMQMGFRHQPSEAEIKSDKKTAEYEKKRTEAKNRMKELFHEREQNEGFLSADKVAELKELSARYGDLYYQNIEFIDQTGNGFLLSIPNLALLPIKPLAISEADFSYEFQVASENIDYKQMGAVYKKPEEEKERPWFLIKEPKSIRGHFAARKEESSEASIKINIKVANTPTPYGLEKLMVHLTNNMEVVDKKDE
jgi:hypothetical protein